MKRRRVKITGIGPVTPAGIGKDAFWKGILEPVSRVKPFTKMEPGYGSFVACTIDRFDASRYIDKARLPKGAARHTLLAIAATMLALKDAGITLWELSSKKSAIITGSSIMDFGGIINSIDGLNDRGLKGVQARTLHTTGIGSVPSSIAYSIGINARTLAVSNQCNSGLDAIGTAAMLVGNGEVDIALCGGTEAPLHRSPMLEMRAGELISASDELSDRQARPFDLWRTAGVLAEGASIFVLEPESSERIGYSYVSGYAFASDPLGDICGGMVEAARLAIAQASIHPREIEVLNAWGPGDKRVDQGECAAMRAVFGTALQNIAATSIKGAIGSALGAAPAIQAATAALGQRDGLVTPTVNWQFPDPQCPLNLDSRARAVNHNYTMVNSHGFGAVNASLVLERC